MKKIVIFVMEFIILTLMASSVLASTSINANINTSTENIKNGQEIIITLQFNQYQEIDKGVNAYKATLEYNKDLFEQVRQDDFVGLNNWEQIKYNETSGEFVAIKRIGSKTPEDIVKIKLKIKENAKPQETEIKIKDIITSEGTQDLLVPETKTKITILKEQTGIPGVSTNPEQQGNTSKPGTIPNNSGNVGDVQTPQSTTNNKNEENQDATMATKKFPKAGNKQRKIALMIALAIEILLIMAYVSRQKGKEIEIEINRRTKAMVATLIVSIVSLQAVGSIYAAISNFLLKGELNDDGEINYADVSLLEKHLIHSQTLPEEKLENADMNNDENITVTDLTLLVQKIENTLEYQVHFSDVELENYYPNQNQEITLKFDAYVSYEANIKTAIINGKEYKVEKIEGTTSQYTFKTNTGNVGGIQEYHFTQVLLDNEKRVNVNYTLKIDVLKQMPKIENYMIEEDINEQKIKLFFDVVDKDNSMTSAVLEIFNESQEVIQEEEIIKGQNQIEVAVEDGKKYTANFVLGYDLDSNELSKEEDHTGIEQITKELQMIIDYNFKMSNIETKKDGKSTTIFEKKEPIQLVFESTNATKFEPTTIKVKGKEYSVLKQDNKYIAMVDGIQELGEQEIAIEEVILGNGKKFTLEKDNKIKLKIIKQKPTITEFKTSENIEENNIKIGFILKDEDKTINKTTILLLDAEGKEIERQELSSEEIENAGNIEKTFSTRLTAKYKVKIMATYNQTGEEKDNVTDSILLEQEVKAEPRAVIMQATCNKDYVEKGESVVITYDIETNKTENIEKICINNAECNATKLVDGRYEVTLPVHENSGIEEFLATQVIYTDKTRANVNKVVRIDVLKNKPRIENFKQEDKEQTSQVTLNFNLIDEDESFVSGKAVFTKQEDNTIKEEKEIGVGENSLTFNVENAKMYTLELKVTYDRDTNTLEDKPQEDNKVTDEVLVKKEIELLLDYELQINNIKTYKEQAESKYFAKNENITVKFESTNISKFVPVKAIINGKEYNLMKMENTYQTDIDTYADYGPKDITIEKIILNNTKELEVLEKKQTKIEILKDLPTVSEFGYTEEDDNTITAKFQINDVEESITGGHITITDENKQQVKTQEISNGENSITFEKTSSESYMAEIVVDYDLDTNAIETGKNEKKNVILLEDEINVGDRLIEMKDIETITLYKQVQNNVNEITSVSIKDLEHLESYLVKVTMKDMPEFYTTISEYKIENGNLKFVLNYDNIIQYHDDKKTNTLEVTYGAIENNIAKNQSLEELIQQIKKDPNGNYTLTKDLDASNIGTTTTIVDDSITFTGTLNGNGHKIVNLSKPLFHSCNGATIENLVLQDASMTANGILANNVASTTVRNVHIKNATVKAPNINGTGSLIGQVTVNSLIEKSSATNITVGNAKRTGGFIGQMNNSIVRDCYVQGNVSTTWDGSGGFIGETPSGCTIENVYANVKTDFGSGTNAGIAGWSQNVVMKNVLSIANNAKDGYPYRVYGSGLNNNSSNIYELESSNMISQANHKAISVVTEEELRTKEFYKEKLKWDESIWNLDGVVNGQYPFLRNSDPANNVIEQPDNTNIYIPAYSRLNKLANYHKAKEIAYSNLYQLMPFYDAKYLLVDGAKISEDDILNTKIIKHILPYDRNKKLVTNLTEDDYQKITTIKVIFEDDSTKDYTVTFDECKGHIASYKIEELGIIYNYNRYVVKQNATIVNQLSQYIENLNYTNDLDPLTTEADSRLYRDYFNETIKPDRLALVLKILQYGKDDIVTIENAVLNKKIENDLIQNGKLKQIVYAYNYYKRWYNINIEGAEVTDILLFNGKLFSNTMTFERLVNEVMASNSNRSTGETQKFYANNVAKYTGKADIGQFLDYIINHIGDYKDSNDWFTQNYQGIVAEVPAENYPTVEYRAWRQLKRRNNFLLPFMTLPKDSAYIVSSPTQFLVGAQRTYISDPSNAEQKQELKTKIEAYCKLISNFYTTTAGFIEAETLNQYTDIQVDHRFTKDANGKSSIQDAGTTQEPFHKNFNEAVNYWSASNGSAAYATGSNVYWVVYSALSSFSTWSHESGHNQDGKIFLKGYGRRPGGWAEDYADGNTTQSGGDGGENFNLAYEYNRDSTTTTNLTPERINSTQKIESYYKAMYETIHFLDYVEMKAFLTLTPEEQSKVAVQVFYPKAEEAEKDENGNFTPTSTTYDKTGWRVLTADQLKKMNLQTIENIYDNHITIKPGVTSVSTADIGPYGRYGCESIYTRYWYQAHNDYGRPDSYTFKHLAWEMLGIGGYDGGYVTYFSGKSKNDLDALQLVTKDPTMTWRKYKINRYEQMKLKWNVVKYINADEVLKQYIDALKLDAKNGDRNITASTNVRRLNYHYLKRVTNDFRVDPLNSQVQITHIKTPEQFQEAITKKPYGYYVLDNDIDVSALTGTNAIIDGVFTGRLDGQGHKITGNTLPIFEKIFSSYIYNLTVEGSHINSQQAQVGAIAKVASIVNVKDVVGNNIEITTTGNEVGALFGNMQQANMENIHVTNTTIQGAARVGGMAGYVNYNTIKESSVNATVTATGNADGGFIGEVVNSTVTNSYSLGTLKGRQDVGGFIGYVNNSSIYNSFSNVATEATVNGAGCFIGQVVNKASKIENNIAFGNGKNAYKFDGRTGSDIFANYHNNYEYEETKGTPTINRTGINFEGKITSAKLTDVTNIQFYTNTLNWANTIWDFKNVPNEGLPKLKNLDKNDVTSILEKTEISSIEDFMKIQNDPDAIYSLKKDIDFTSYTADAEGAVITATFTGKIEGNGHTISNLKNASLFKNFRGTVQNLNISNFSNQGVGDYRTAFTKESYVAVFKNMTFTNITLEGGNNVAVVTGMDGRENANTVFDRITVKNAKVKGSGVYISTFIGRKYGGKVTNCYVQGKIECTTTECGGIIGATHQGVQIENIVANVNIDRPRSTDDRNNNGGFIGNIYDAPTIKNSISIGNMTGFTETATGKEINVYKFAGCTEENIKNHFLNCYELKTATGTSSITASTQNSLKEATLQNLKDKSFYKDILKFDETIWNLDRVIANGYPELR